MKANHRRTLRHSLTLVLLLALSYGAWLMLRPATEAENRLSSAETELDARIGKLSDRSTDETKLSERRSEAVKLAADRWFEELLERYPWMQPEFRDIPDNQNGRLLYSQFLTTLDGGEHSERLSLPPEIRRQLEGEDEFNPGRLTQWFEENQILMDQILMIAEAPDRSCKNFEHQSAGFTNALPARTMSHLLTSKARIAIMNGDEASAKRFFAAAMNLAAHMDQTETPSFLDQTIAILLEQQTISSFHEHILPSLPQDPENLSEWRSLLAISPDFDQQLAKIVRGEWRVTTRQFILPALLNAGHSNNITAARIRDHQSLLDAYAHSLTLVFGQAHMPGYDSSTYVDPANLQRASKETLSVVEVGVEAWQSGLFRAATEAAMNDALLAILIGEEPPVDPVSGKPFIWDEESQSILPPEGTEEIEPIVLN